MFKNTIAKVRTNPIGFVAGAGLTWWALGKYAPTTNIWIRVAGIAIGGVVGSNVQSMVVSKAGAAKSAGAAKTASGK
jgi:hypothetical protein